VTSSGASLIPTAAEWEHPLPMTMEPVRHQSSACTDPANGHTLAGRAESLQVACREAWNRRPRRPLPEGIGDGSATKDEVRTLLQRRCRLTTTQKRSKRVTLHDYTSTSSVVGDCVRVSRRGCSRDAYSSMPQFRDSVCVYASLHRCFSFVSCLPSWVQTAYLHSSCQRAP